jgi:hypothetical protein
VKQHWPPFISHQRGPVIYLFTGLNYIKVDISVELCPSTRVSSLLCFHIPSVSLERSRILPPQCCTTSHSASRCCYLEATYPHAGSRPVHLDLSMLYDIVVWRYHDNVSLVLLLRGRRQVRLSPTRNANDHAFAKCMYGWYCSVM